MNLFADTSGLAHFADRAQTHHARAVECVGRVCDGSGRLVTTNYVLAELTALFDSPMRLPKAKQYEFVGKLRAADWIEVVHINADLDAAAWALWSARPDKQWSLTDCASFVVMQGRRLTDALTSDHHFEQAGFVRLLK